MLEPPLMEAIVLLMPAAFWFHVQRIQIAEGDGGRAYVCDLAHGRARAVADHDQIALLNPAGGVDRRRRCGRIQRINRQRNGSAVGFPQWCGDVVLEQRKVVITQ